MVFKYNEELENVLRRNQNLRSLFESSLVGIWMNIAELAQGVPAAEDSV